jgi:uncharacterized protein (DUF2141 family)
MADSSELLLRERELGKKPPLAVTTVSVTSESALILTLLIDDPELIVELKKYQDGSVRNSFATSALRIGILALRQAQGQVDAEILRAEGGHLLSEMKQELQLRVAEIDTKVAATLKQYFDPDSGHFTERVERLVKKDGDLERVLRNQIGDAENSELARALARRIGEHSPLMRRLNPDDAGSITASIEASVTEILQEEQTGILREFSLDNKDGALTRVVSQIEKKNGEFKGDIAKQIKDAVKEFSLDDENSALSRLVKKVEEANNQITEEFSEANEHSAINRLNSMLTETKNSIQENLTLDNDHSALARLKKQLNEVLDDIRSKNQQFQEDVSAKLAALITRRKEAQRSTTHGNDFEEEFCKFVRDEAQKSGDIFTPTGTKVGATPKCKKGDGVVEINPESTAAGEKIVLEAKGNKSYTLGDARIEIEEARKNRGAKVGVFVFEKSRAPEQLQPFTRIDSDIFVVWDAADSSTDVYLSAAISVAKALVFRDKLAEKKADGDLDGIELSVNIIEKRLKALDDMETWTNTIHANSGKILKEITKLRDAAAEQIEGLRSCLEALKSNS